MTAQFKPGDRVLVEAVVESANDEVSWVDIAGHAVACLPISAIRHLPTDAQKLRDAAEVCRQTREFRYDDWGRICPSYIAVRLEDIAKHLEAATAPKPPTLREAAERLSEAYNDDDGLASTERPEFLARVRPLWEALDEALAREPSP